MPDSSIISFLNNVPLLLIIVNVQQVHATSLTTQPAITYSKLTIETLEQGVTYVQS